MTNNIQPHDAKALILGAGNIAVSHVKALKYLGYSIDCYDPDKRKAEIFSSRYKIKTFSSSDKYYHLVVLCVPFEYRTNFFEQFKRQFDKADKIVIEKPLTDNNCDSHEYVLKNIERIWTPYLRTFPLKRKNSSDRISIIEHRGLLHSSSSIIETIYDLLPHWLSVIAFYGITFSEYSIEFNNDKQAQLTFIQDNKVVADVMFKLATPLFKVSVDEITIEYPTGGVPPLPELINNFRYYLDIAKAGNFYIFYKTVLQDSVLYKQLCNHVFQMSRIVKITNQAL